MSATMDVESWTKDLLSGATGDAGVTDSLDAMLGNDSIFSPTLSVSFPVHKNGDDIFSI